MFKKRQVLVLGKGINNEALAGVLESCRFNAFALSCFL